MKIVKGLEGRLYEKQLSLGQFSLEKRKLGTALTAVYSFLVKGSGRESLMSSLW